MSHLAQIPPVIALLIAGTYTPLAIALLEDPRALLIIIWSCAAGLIADGVHVHPAAMSLALAARPEGIFLVTDCMAFAGTDLTRMVLQGRVIHRRDGRLTLADGIHPNARAIGIVADRILPHVEAALDGAERRAA